MELFGNIIDNISSNMAVDEDIDMLSNGSIQFKEDDKAIIERLSKITMSSKTYSLKDILSMLSKNENTVLEEFTEKNITISNEKLNTNISFTDEDILYFWVVNRHQNGITNQNYVNKSAMKKIVEILK